MTIYAPMSAAKAVKARATGRAAVDYSEEKQATKPAAMAKRTAKSAKAKASAAAAVTGGKSRKTGFALAREKNVSKIGFNHQQTTKKLPDVDTINKCSSTLRNQKRKDSAKCLTPAPRARLK